MLWQIAVGHTDFMLLLYILVRSRNINLKIICCSYTLNFLLIRCPYRQPSFYNIYQNCKLIRLSQITNSYLLKFIICTPNPYYKHLYVYECIISISDYMKLMIFYNLNNINNKLIQSNYKTYLYGPSSRCTPQRGLDGSNQLQVGKRT